MVISNVFLRKLFLHPDQVRESTLFSMWLEFWMPGFAGMTSKSDTVVLSPSSWLRRSLQDIQKEGKELVLFEDHSG